MYRPVKHDKAFSRQMHLSIFSKKLHHRYLTGFQKSFCEVEIFRPNSSIISLSIISFHGETSSYSCDLEILQTFPNIRNFLS